MLVLDHLRKDFARVGALREISLSINDGEFVAVVGPSGCGKTTLLRLIAGFEEPTAGRVSLNGTDITQLPPHRRHIGMVFQNYALFPHMTVRANIAFGLEAQKRPAAEIISRVEEAAARVRLSHKLDVEVPRLSGGEQQRVAVARAIVTQPALLLMDEPLSNLDPVLREEMRFEIARVQRETGLTTVYVTHDQAEALSLADRVAVLRSGVLEQFDTPRAIFFHPANPFVASFMGGAQEVPGTIDPSRGGVVLASGLVIPWVSPAAHVGGDAMVSIKPEAISLNTSGTPAIIVNCAFTGGMTEYQIDIGGLMLRARIPSNVGATHTPGTSINVIVDPGLCSVFPS